MKEPERRKRNRIAGVVIFLLLIVACVVYYDYCCSHSPVEGENIVVAGERRLVQLKKRMSSTLSTARMTDGPADDAKRQDSSAASGQDAAPAHGKSEPDVADTQHADIENGGLVDAGDSTGRSSANDSRSDEMPLFEGLAYGMEMPYVSAADADFVIVHGDGRYTLLYDTLYRQADWVAYVLTDDDVAAVNVGRDDKFIVDPEVRERGYPYAVTSDYVRSGYDRGHLCPSADRRASEQENQGTFYMSNITPQTPSLNRGVWRLLEDQVRDWAVEFGAVYVVAGGVLEPGLDTLSGGIGIPEYFYKALLTERSGDVYAIGFLFPNIDKVEGRYRDYVVTVDSLEALTQHDFFTSLPDGIEAEAESRCCYEFWFGE